MKDDLLLFFEKVLFESLKEKIRVQEFKLLSGGCINHAAKIITAKGAFFIKWNSSKWQKMFLRESEGLNLLQKNKTTDIPEIHGNGVIDDKSYLLLENIESKSAASLFWEQFGQKLSELHKITNRFYGLEYNNYIGTLEQNNIICDSWVPFFIENRLDAQIELAYEKDLVTTSFLKKFKNIYHKLPEILPEEQPSLLHGDLWSGNFISGKDGKPYLIDPAVYYGNREAEIAFTKLFGGFSPLFYDSYHESFPLQPNFEERVEIYNLYYLLVHVNLFGTSYLSSVISTVNSLQ